MDRSERSNNLISIIVPIYNVEKYLNRCIDSIINQTYKNIEIILVDDGSPDNCGKICDEYAKKDSRIVVIHKENGGLSDSRNAGIDIAKGEYLGFVDSDDYIAPDMYEKLINAINNADMAVCNYLYVDELGNNIKEFNSELPVKNEVLGQEQYFNKIYQEKGWYYVTAWNKLYKKELFETLRYPYGKYHEDEFIIHKLIYQCKEIHCIAEPLVFYVQREGSIMNEGYSIKRMDRTEAWLDRTVFFVQKKMSDKLIINSYNGYITKLYESYEKRNKKDKSYRPIYKSLYKKQRKITRKMCFLEIPAKTKIKLVLRSIHPELYYIILNKIIRGGIISVNIAVKTILINASSGKVLVDTPQHGNLGDHAIALAERQLLAKKGRFCEITGNEIDNNEEKYAARIRKNKTILIHGGGFMGALWRNEEERLRRIITAFHDHKIIIFPQTVTFNMNTEEGKKYFEESKRIYASHPNLTLMVREEKSYKFMKEYMPEINTVLTPDIVLFLQHNIINIRRKGVLMCMRSDCERSVTEEKTAEILSWAESKFNGNVIFTDTVLDHDVSVKEREYIVKEKLKEFSSTELVITDRLHGMIFAALTSTPCIAMGNINNKVKNVYKWIEYLPYVSFLEQSERIEDVYDKMQQGDYKYDNEPLMKYYEIIKQQLLD